MDLSEQKLDKKPIGLLFEESVQPIQDIRNPLEELDFLGGETLCVKVKRHQILLNSLKCIVEW